MKRIVFLIIASLLVLGLVLPGCNGTTPEEDILKIAVCGPMDFIQGEAHKAGAEMARDEINAAGGVDIGGTPHDIELVIIDTEEATEGEDGTIGAAELLAVIDDVAFVVGGFRTEVVSVYREIAVGPTGADKIFMNCGAAPGGLQYSVVADYDNYKYWFKATPYNTMFLLTSLLRMTATIGDIFKGTLEAYDGLVHADYKVSSAVGGKLRVEILGETAAWCAGIMALAPGYLQGIGFNVTGSTTVSPTASNIETELGDIEANKPHIIFTALSGQVGAVYSTTRVSLGIPAMTIGINVPAQSVEHWTNTGGDCEGEILLDTFAVNFSLTDTTLDFMDDYWTKTGDYPVYTSGTYDAIKAVCLAIEDVGLGSDAIVAWLEDLDNAQTGVGATTAYYPMGAIDKGAGVYALSEAQVRDLYDIDSYGYVYSEDDWLCAPSDIDGPHIRHDTTYGPGYQTGMGAQWQLFGAEGHKVGVWPMDLGDVPALVDQYGDWSFEYPGTADLYIPIEDFYA